MLTRLSQNLSHNQRLQTASFSRHCETLITRIIVQISPTEFCDLHLGFGLEMGCLNSHGCLASFVAVLGPSLHQDI